MLNAPFHFTEERQRLADAVKQHQSQQNSVPAQPEGKHPVKLYIS